MPPSLRLFNYFSLWIFINNWTITSQYYYYHHHDRRCRYRSEVVIIIIYADNTLDPNLNLFRSENVIRSLLYQYFDHQTLYFGFILSLDLHRYIWESSSMIQTSLHTKLLLLLLSWPSSSWFSLSSLSLSFEVDVVVSIIIIIYTDNKCDPNFILFRSENLIHSLLHQYITSVLPSLWASIFIFMYFFFYKSPFDRVQFILISAKTHFALHFSSWHLHRKSFVGSIFPA